MTLEQVAIIMLVTLLVMVFVGVPLAFSLMFLSVIFGLVYRGTVIFSLFQLHVFGVVKNEVIVAVPLFIFMGCLLERCGAAEKVYGALHQLLGPMRGGLAATTVLVCTVFATCTGVIAASVITMALIALPAMLKRGYDKGLATGVVCAGGTLGIIIPPSVMLVLYGPMANISVAKLFAGAIFPGLLLSTLYLTYIGVRCWLQPEMGPPVSIDERAEARGKLLSRTVLYLLPVFFLIVAVLGSILGGVATPTEASAMGAFGALLIAAGYRNLNLQTLKQAACETVKITSMALFVIVGASMFTAVFLALRGGFLIESFLLGLPLGTWFIFVMMMFIIFILGMVIDWIGILYIIVPTFLPIAATLGFDPLWFALLICVNLQMSFLTPPFAYAIFFVKGVAPPEVTTQDIYRGVIPFVALQVVGLGLCILFPQIILWLPRVTLGA